MTEISNIDAIIDLIMREARARKGPNLSVRIYNVRNEVDRKLWTLSREHLEEERRKKKDEDNHQR